MQPFLAMRRANGDWYAVSHNGQLRIPIFRTNSGAWRFRVRNPDTTVFRQVALDSKALGSFADDQKIAFWLIDEDDSGGRLLSLAELQQLASDSS